MGRSRARFASAQGCDLMWLAPYGTPAHSDPALWGVPEWRSLISSTPPHKVSCSRTSDEGKVGVRTSRGPLSLAHCMLHRRARQTSFSCRRGQCSIIADLVCTCVNCNGVVWCRRRARGMSLHQSWRFHLVHSIQGDLPRLEEGL